MSGRKQLFVLICLELQLIIMTKAILVNNFPVPGCQLAKNNHWKASILCPHFLLHSLGSIFIFLKASYMWLGISNSITVLHEICNLTEGANQLVCSYLFRFLRLRFFECSSLMSFSQTQLLEPILDVAFCKPLRL